MTEPRRIPGPAPVLRSLVVGLALMAAAAPDTEAATTSVATTAPSTALTADCRVACGLVLGATSFTIATGTAVTWGRLTGGIQSPTQGKSIWAISFGASLATAVTLSGSRRERTVYSAGIGAAAGAAAGTLLLFTLDAVGGDSEGSAKVAAALIGAAVGAVAGGVYGAYSHEEGDGARAAMAAQRFPLVAVRIPF